MTPVSGLASLMLFAGLYLLGRKKRTGFIFSVVGEALWATVAIQREMFDLAAVCLAFGLMAGVNFKKWGSE